MKRPGAVAHEVERVTGIFFALTRQERADDCDRVHERADEGCGLGGDATNGDQRRGRPRSPRARNEGRETREPELGGRSLFAARREHRAHRDVVRCIGERRVDLRRVVGRDADAQGPPAGVSEPPRDGERNVVLTEVDPVAPGKRREVGTIVGEERDSRSRGQRRDAPQQLERMHRVAALVPQLYRSRPRVQDGLGESHRTDFGTPTPTDICQRVGVHDRVESTHVRRENPRKTRPRKGRGEETGPCSP